MRRTFVFLFLVSIVFVPVIGASALSNDQYNQRDDQGLRQGIWKGFFESGALRYEGNFVNDKPTGVFKYFYPQGGLRAELIHQPGEEAVKATYYHRNRAIMGEGFFLNRQMEGLWRFFNESRVLVAEHFYQNGKNHGVWKTYYPNGRVAELQTWHRGKMQGLFERYYRDGSIYIRAYYKNDLLHGTYEVFYPSGRTMLAGYYTDNLNDKAWTWYSDRGELEKKAIYDAGSLIREEIFIEKNDEAIPLRPGPTRNDMPWGANGLF